MEERNRSVTSHQNPALLIMTPQQPMKGRILDDTYLASTVSVKTKRKSWVNKRC